MVTGDYSRGAAGLWIENGQLTHAVEEVTIAGNLGEMLKQCDGDRKRPGVSRIGGLAHVADRRHDDRGSLSGATPCSDGFQSRSVRSRADAKAALAQVPQRAAVFRLVRRGRASDEPYIGRTPNLRGRLERLLQPSAKHPRRLQLAGLVRRIEWQLTGSEFESLLPQFSLLEEVYGAKALRAMHLGARRSCASWAAIRIRASR